MSSSLFQDRGKLRFALARGSAALAIAVLGSSCLQIGINGGLTSSSSAISSNSTFYSQWIDSSGNLYIADTGDNMIRRVNSSGTISTYPNLGDRFVREPGKSRRTDL